jgi:DNA polymerase III gamma/tau subunit
MELYKKYRPAALGSVVGQEEAVKFLEAKLTAESVPHALMFTGPSGCGKTTIARIVARRLGCNVDKLADFGEVNCAMVDPLETVRGIQQAYRMHPMFGTCRVWLLDEFQSFSRAGNTQQAMLKLLEEEHATSYFMLATTNPSKIIPTVRNRCTEVKLGLISDAKLTELVRKILRLEKVKLTDRTVSKVTELAQGSARKALVLLDQVIHCDDKEALEILHKPDEEAQSIDLAKALINPRSSWNDVRSVLTKLNKDEVERTRQTVLTYCRNVLLGDTKLKHLAFLVIQEFRDNFFDSGLTGLAAACYAIKGK